MKKKINYVDYIFDLLRKINLIKEKIVYTREIAGD